MLCYSDSWVINKWSNREEEMSLLDMIGELPSIHRRYYGDDKDNPPKGMPSDKYYWDNNILSYSYGWNESDSSLRERIRKRNETN